MAIDEPRDQRRAENPGPSPDGPAAQPVTDPSSGGADPAASPGARLTAARVAAGMSVDEVSARTRIRATLIRQMEADDFAAVGGAVYARGHIRGIARALGADPEPIVAAFAVAQPAGAPPSLRAPTNSFDPLRHGATSGSSRRWGTAMVVAAVVFCVVLVFTLLRPGPSHGRPGATSSSRSPVAAAPARPAPAPTTPAPTEVSLRLQAVGAPSWLQVSDDSNKVLYQQILTQGASQTLTAKAMRVRIGNAGAMSLNCNGHDLGSLGGPGQVVTVQLGLGDAGACKVEGGPASAGPAR
ncbi:helix-turn-helix domain-containing protein [Pseudofrankia sp. DC12]|uniref:helix-turn-helix domain-containing protein n=1 Tax=Pseudofrankia sp. DC12 TaxID=683315 RepID=UPI0012F80E80|nr:helix-turn-helix domain-containing protein [Pseudofrankia sp. DC12]